jgi:4-alpha-glucanotransferase
MRRSGILLHVSSLPGSYGIGTFGAGAYTFIDFLKKSKQTFWQILPLGPTSYGDSPYQTFSAFALNHYFIDLDMLIKEGLLSKKDIIMHKVNPKDINYGALFEDRLPILKKAFSHFKGNKAYEKFLKEQPWLDDYSLFMALKEYYHGKPFNHWDSDIKHRHEGAIKYYQEKLSETINLHKFLQFKAYEQWLKLKSYANKKGIQIIGDIPIYLAYDSSDVWADPIQFQLNHDKEMTHVAGVPPDGFSADGQLWGNPLYNWGHHEYEGYKFWINRIKSQLNLYDWLRIDHFIGFEHYYSIPNGSQTARYGAWLDGPSKKLFDAIKNALGPINIIAEDLGRVTERVVGLLKHTGFPGMKLTQFAFYDQGNNLSLPHGFPYHTFSYTGTHDNETTRSWAKHVDLKTKKHVMAYTNASSPNDITRALIKETLKSPSMVSVIPMQDYLNLGDEGRMNAPATIGTNWRYRMQYKDLTLKLQRDIAKLTNLYGRHPEQKNEVWIEAS